MTLRVRRYVSGLLVPPTEHIQSIASVLEVPDADVKATTYVGELEALYPDLNMYHGFRTMTYPNHRRLVTKLGVHVCPNCLAEEGNLMGRSHWLVGLSHCPIHHVMSRGYCTYGLHLNAFPSGPVRG